MNFVTLAQLVERKTFNLVVMGSSPMVGKFLQSQVLDRVAQLVRAPVL